MNAACRPAQSLRTCLSCSCRKDSEQKIDLGQMQSMRGSVAETDSFGLLISGVSGTGWRLELGTPCSGSR